MAPPVRPVPFTVRVSEAPPEFADAGESEKMRGPLNGKLFREMSHAPRPCVAARSVRDAS